jgi:hypothetical protein
MINANPVITANIIISFILLYANAVSMIFRVEIV